MCVCARGCVWECVMCVCVQSKRVGVRSAHAVHDACKVCVRCVHAEWQLCTGVCKVCAQRQGVYQRGVHIVQGGSAQCKGGCVKAWMHWGCVKL